MMRIGMALGGSLAAVALVVYAVGALRQDAKNDLLRELLIEQTENDLTNVRERQVRVEEIANESPDELRARACAGGMLSAEDCAN